MATAAISRLDQKPTIDELIEHVDVSTKWHTVGLHLKLADKSLVAIDDDKRCVADKVKAMYRLWLGTCPTASRKQLISVLKMKSVALNTLAYDYEKMSSALPVQSFNQTPLIQETISPSSNVCHKEISQAEHVQRMENKRSQVAPNDLPVNNSQTEVVISELTERVQRVRLVENYQRAPDDLQYNVVKPEMTVGENDQKEPDDVHVAPTKYSQAEMVVGDDDTAISRTSNIYQSPCTDRNEHDYVI
jgi:hypothetical protein